MGAAERARDGDLAGARRQRELQGAHVLRRRRRAAARVRRAARAAARCGARRRSSCSAVLGLAIPLHAPGPVLAGRRTCRRSNWSQNQRLHFVFEWRWRCWRRSGCRRCSTGPRSAAGSSRWRSAASASALVALPRAGARPRRRRPRRRALRRPGGTSAAAACMELTTVAWFLLFALGVTRRCSRCAAGRGRARGSPPALVLLAALDMLHFANGYNPMAPAEGDPAAHAGDRVPAGAPRRGSHSRRSSWRSAGRSLRYGLADVRGYDPPFPTKRYLDTVAAGRARPGAWMPTTIAGISPAAVQVTGALGARYMIADPASERCALSRPGGAARCNASTTGGSDDLPQP